ncbi:cytochrome P450 [Actinomadura algeriensis]|uniref:Cytochrome P450 n=1 Tax=Actinomadura algeriensis TaxID=1679523 RepID=A0ABR9JJU3_9ACTN|nr:cytochrome P450 [Actinomadura algeriensis]MBE1530656.1 cytochrome P450 [Actinomadura algeriensis]
MSGPAGGDRGSAPADRPALPAEIAELADPANREDPYPFLDGLRARSPYAPFDGLVVVGRHAQSSALLRDPTMSARRDRAALSPTPRGPRTRNFLHLDPPEHTRYRRLVAGAFARRRVEGLGPRIREIAAGLLRDAAGSGTIEVVDDLAYPLPLRVICELLGVPFEDRRLLQDWSASLSAALDPPLGPAPPRLTTEAARARAGFVGYFRDLIEERRGAPRDDLISHLVQVEEHGERLDDHDVLATCVLLLNAGHETTVNLIGNAVLALLRHPRQFDRLRADPALAAATVEEVLRYDAPVQMTTRVAREDGRVGGTRVRPGDTVLVLLGAANRDPDVYPDPGRFDIGRSPAAPHLSFSAGPHFCLGAGLARLEVSVALGLFAGRLVRPRLRPGGVAYKRNLNLRGPARLLVDLDDADLDDADARFHGVRSG